MATLVNLLDNLWGGGACLILTIAGSLAYIHCAPSWYGDDQPDHDSHQYEIEERRRNDYNPDPNWVQIGEAGDF